MTIEEIICNLSDLKEQQELDQKDKNTLEETVKLIKKITKAW